MDGEQQHFSSHSIQLDRIYWRVQRTTCLCIQSTQQGASLDRYTQIYPSPKISIRCYFPSCHLLSVCSKWSLNTLALLIYWVKSRVNTHCSIVLFFTVWFTLVRNIHSVFTLPLVFISYNQYTVVLWKSVLFFFLFLFFSVCTFILSSCKAKLTFITAAIVPEVKWWDSKGQMTKSFVAIHVLMITDITSTASPLIFPLANCFISHLSPFHALCVHFCAMFLYVCVWVCVHPTMFIVLRLCPWRFKLLSSRHGSTTEVGFIQVHVQNDASRTAYYNTLIHSGLYRGGEKEERDWGQRGQE